MRALVISALAVGAILLSACSGDDSVTPVECCTLRSVAGAGAFARAGEQLPRLLVRAEDGAGRGRAGLRLDWTATGGRLHESASTTDANGYAGAVWLADTLVGMYELQVRADAVNAAPLIIRLAVSAGPLWRLDLIPDTVNLDVGTFFRVDELAYDRYGNVLLLRDRPPTEWSVSDTTIIRRTNAGVQGLRSGAAWVRATMGTLADSTRVVVAGASGS